MFLSALVNLCPTSTSSVVMHNLVESVWVYCWIVFGACKENARPKQMASCHT